MNKALKRKTHPDNLWVETYWQVKTFLSSPRLSRLPASHLGHLILAPTSHLSHYHCKEREISLKGSHILYPQMAPTYLNQTSQVFLSGAELTLGTLYLISKKLGRSLPTHGPIAEHISMPFEENLSFENSVKTFDTIFEELHLGNEVDGHYTLSKEVEILLRRSPNRKLNNIGDELNASQRTIERSFKLVTGMSLKTYQNIYRFNNYLEDFLGVLNNEKISADSLYYFYDQSHCIRQFQDYVGQSPRQLLKSDDLISSLYHFQDS